MVSIDRGMCEVIDQHLPSWSVKDTRESLISAVEFLSALDRICERESVSIERPFNGSEEPVFFGRETKPKDRGADHIQADYQQRD